MANVTVIGAQWGDEGKGKIVDWLAARSDVVVRFQGGHNAGHTLRIDGEEYRLSLLPSGIVREGTMSVLGNGVVIDAEAFAAEAKALRERGVEVSPSRLRISDAATLILPLHRELDALRERNAGAARLGTTGRGIGPAYEDKVGRRAVRVADLAHEAAIDDALSRLLAHHDAIRRGFGLEPIDPSAARGWIRSAAEILLPYADSAWSVLDAMRREGKRILFEGAQGVMLDVDHGTYPYVTSSNATAASAALGSGVAPSATGFVLGIAKAYATRVGEGPFPTELDDDVGRRLGERGKEFGTVTGRARRCGWLDGPLLRQAVRVGGIDGLAVTKLDVLDGFEEIFACEGYEIDGERFDHLPSSREARRRARPIYRRFEGWRESTRGVRKWSDLPAEAVKYVRCIEELAECPAALLSTSPEREDVVAVRDPFAG